MTRSKEAALAALTELEAAVRAAREAAAGESSDLSHAGHAARIDLVERLTASLAHHAAEAIHAVNLLAISHDFVDFDHADIIEARIGDACADEYGPALERQRMLALAERRETAFRRRLAA